MRWAFVLREEGRDPAPLVESAMRDYAEAARLCPEIEPRVRRMMEMGPFRD
ncbi:MAG: hypothetical protein HYY16_11365 [Planctomycetes bacterium]|nr:hypothetical protein [Planctomycetota bacterium]